MSMGTCCEEEQDSPFLLWMRSYRISGQAHSIRSVVTLQKNQVWN